MTRWYNNTVTVPANSIYTVTGKHNLPQGYKYDSVAQANTGNGNLVIVTLGGSETDYILVVKNITGSAITCGASITLTYVRTFE